MAYSVSKISTTADCDLLLTMAAKEKADLQFKKLSGERQQTSYNENSVEIYTELQLVEAEIAAVTTIIATLPEGPTKENEVKRKKKLEYRKFLLEDREESYGVVALLEKELDITRLGLEITEIDGFITSVTERKAAL
jgi:hypothetical protein